MSEIEIHIDEDPESPREWNNLGTFWTFHPHYRSPDPDPDPDYDLSDCIYLPVFIYDHSGVAYSTTPFHCPWDSGWVGFIFIPKAKVREEFGWKLITAARRSKIEQYLRDEVETYSKYASGEVYGFVIPETGDSCWGFYSREEAYEAAKELETCQI